MKLSDLHCDTPFELYAKRCSLWDGSTAYTLKKCKDSDIRSMLQVMAIWTDTTGKNATFPEELFSDFLAMRDNLAREIERCKEFCEKLPKIILAVEGAELIGKDINRLYTLRENGVKILTPMWKGTNALGGAYDCDEGLTPFGKDVIRECTRLGILTDVSHMSQKSFWDTVNICEGAFLATHSDSFALCGHPRNLTDVQVRTVAGSTGLVGVSACAKHIAGKYADSPPADGDTFVKEFCNHIEHYLSLGDDVAAHICLGCDFDGTSPPAGITDVSCMTKVQAELVSRGIDESVVEGVMWKNAYRFFEGENNGSL